MHKPSHIKEFSRNSDSYKSYNNIQKKVARDLLGFVNFVPKSVLDLGCGDGIIFSKLDWKLDKFVGVDLSEDMLKLHPKGKNIKLIKQDFDELESSYFKEFDLVISSSALQWSKDCKRLIDNLQKNSKNFAVAVFCDGTFKSIREFFDIETFLPNSNNLIKILKDNLHHEKKYYKLEFKNNLSMLRYIKKSGVSGGKKRVGISKIRDFISLHDRCELEFEVLFIHSSM